MRILILSVLLMVITSFTTVTLAAIPSSQGLVTDTVLKKYSYLDTSKVINTEQLKIDPRWVQGLSNISNYKPILHIDPGSQDTVSNYTLARITEPILHIDPGNQEFGSLYNYNSLAIFKEPVLHIDPGRD